MIDCGRPQQTGPWPTCYSHTSRGPSAGTSSRGQRPGGRGSVPHAHPPWLHREDFKRLDAVPPTGDAAGSDYAFVCEQLLARVAIDVAILTGEGRSRSPR